MFFNGLLFTIALILGWDADYRIDSAAALVFEGFMIRFVPAVYAALGRTDEGAFFTRLNRERAMLREDLAQLDAAGWQTALRAGLERAAEIADAGTTWGDVHRLDVQHLLGNLPVLGSRYRIETVPVPGSRETVLKTSHNVTDEDHRTNFGAQARHVSDMADPDENYFVLLGGQDGWIGSPNFADQVPLWREGGYVRVPLRPESVAARFPIVTKLNPR